MDLLSLGCEKGHPLLQRKKRRGEEIDVIYDHPSHSALDHQAAEEIEGLFDVYLPFGLPHFAWLHGGSDDGWKGTSTPSD